MKQFPAQYNLQENDVLYFSHIPKTAGMTFRTIVEDQFAVSETCPATLNAQLRQIPPAQMLQYRLFRGHLGFVNIPELLPGKRVIDVTFLREPIARVVSHYEYIRRMPGDPHYPAVSQMSLEEFCSKLTAGKVGKNIQTYHVAKTARFNLDGLTPTEVLELAKSAIDHYAFVGLVERFQDSLFLLSYIFGWQPIINTRKENAAQTQQKLEQLPPQTLQLLRESTLLDAELYDYAKAVFSDRYPQMVQDLRQRYGTAEMGDTPAVEAMQQMLEQHYQQRWQTRQESTQTLIDYTFAQALHGLGWQRRECPEAGSPYRWTGPGTVATLDFALTPEQDYSIEVQLICTRSTLPAALESFQLSVNDQPIELVMLHRDQDVQLLRGHISQACLRNDRPLTRLVFQTSQTAPLNQITAGQTDKRLVGVAINHVTLFPMGLEQQHSQAISLFDCAAWSEALNFVQTHSQPDEAIVGPLAFSVKLLNKVLDYTAIVTGHQSVQWVILHKAGVERMNPFLVRLIGQGFAPVYANEVFVIFTSKRHLPRLSYTSRYLRFLYWGRLKQHLLKLAKSWRDKEGDRTVKASLADG